MWQEEASNLPAMCGDDGSLALRLNFVQNFCTARLKEICVRLPCWGFRIRFIVPLSIREFYGGEVRPLASLMKSSLTALTYEQEMLC